MRTGRGNVFKEGRERFKALVLRIAAQKCELRSVIGEGVDLAVIELDRADGLRRRIDRLGFGAKAAKGGLSLCAPIQVAIVVGETARPAFDFKRLAVSPSE